MTGRQQPIRAAGADAAVAKPTETGRRTKTGGAPRAKMDAGPPSREEQRREAGEQQASDAALRIRVSSWSSVPTSSADDGVDESPRSEASSHDQDGAKTTAAKAPAARGAKRRRADDTPAFLDKTYEMLERCPAELAAWTPSGESFVVKQPEALAERVIPAYFKHRKFSSFVRQLNLYGFRKVRGLEADGGDAAALTADASEDTSGWWEFRHDRFVRGQREQMRSIRRRSSPPNDSPSSSRSPPVTGTPTAPAASSSTSVATNTSASTLVHRAELDEVRADMRALREQMQQLAKHMAVVMQALVAGRQQPEPTRPVPTTPSYTPTTPGGIAAKQQFAAAASTPAPLSIYAPPAPSLTISTSSSGLPPHMPSAQESLFPSPRHDVKAMRSPVGTYQLRPLQSLITLSSAASGGPGTPVGIPPLPSPRPSPMMSPRLAFLSHAASSYPPVSTPDSSSSQHHSEWEAYARQQRYSRPLPSPSATSPDVAVRQLSQVAAQTRSDLLSCIVARIIGFLRVQQQRQQQQQDRQQSSTLSPGSDSSQEVEGVADAVTSDIALKLAWAQEGAAAYASPMATAASPGGSDVLLDAETAAMYRVEILKFISRELPRALNEAVEKRLAPSQKKALNRSLLALLVQRAQAALEHQMRTTPSTKPADS